MRYYRDLQPGETLQAGDERLWITSLRWNPISMSTVGLPVSLASVCRRPVDLPTLQRVTPEAMAELEARGAVGVVMITPYNQAGDNIVRVMSCVAGKWGHYRDGWRADVSRPSAGWFIELETLKEVQQ